MRPATRTRRRRPGTFGFACDETPDLMPATLYYSHRVLERLAAERHSGAADFLEPDSKSQVTLAYENGKPVRAVKLVVSTQHAKAFDQAKLRDYVKGVFADVMPQGWMPNDDDAIFVNPTGVFEIGGPDGDAGLTGRKIIVDTYGGAAPMAAARSAARIRPGRPLGRLCHAISPRTSSPPAWRGAAIQLARSALPAAVALCRLTALSDGVTAAGSRTCYRSWCLTPKGIRTHLGLNRPIYQPTAAYGHFGPQTRATCSAGKDRLADALKQAVDLPGASCPSGWGRGTVLSPLVSSDG